MNSEEERLRSFATWPMISPVNRNELAALGFFATGGAFLEAECNFCHYRINFLSWDGEQQVDQKHLSASPHCQFLINKDNCGNIKIQETDSSETNSSVTSTRALDSDSSLLIESNRLATFTNWPNPNISPQSLAKAGFFYLNRSDEVMCAWCKGVIAQWEKQDNAFEEHRRFVPDCPRVQLGPLIEIATDGIRDLGIQQMSPPKNPKFLSLDARLRTYTNWPIPDIQKPDTLAQAGLYYQEVDDQVRCFHCNIGLRSWEKEDDPWFEHAKWYPMCQFVRLVKGVTYIQEVQECSHGSSQNTSAASMSIDDAMNTTPVRLALEMGVDVGAIRQKTQRQILATGSPYNTVEDLLKALFDIQEDSENFQSFSGTNCATEISNIPTASTTLNNAIMKVTGSISPNASQSDSRNTSTDESRQQSDKVLQTNLNETSVSTFDNDKSSDHLTLEEENRKLKDARLCKVCLDEEVGVVYLPCGHLVTCVQCAPGVDQCPMCRTTIKGFVRTFLS